MTSAPRFTSALVFASLTLLLLWGCTNPLAVTLTQVPNGPINLATVKPATMVEIKEPPSKLKYQKVAKASIRLFNGQEQQAINAVKKRLANAGCTHYYFGPTPVEALNGQDTFYLPLGDNSFSMNVNTMRRKLVATGYVRR